MPAPRSSSGRRADDTSAIRSETLTLSARDLDGWLPAPSVAVHHQRESAEEPEAVWRAAQSVGFRDAALLGRLVRLRIPGLAAGGSFDQMFREDPFLILDDTRPHGLVSGLVGRIWTPRRDYPRLSDPEEFRRWSVDGTARVLFANWVVRAENGPTVLHSETRVQAFGLQGRIGLATLQPVIRGFHHLIAKDGLDRAVRRAGA